MTEPDHAPPGWPRGASEARVRECNCPTCRELVEQLEQARDGVAVDGEHRTLAAYSEGSA